MVQRIVDLGLLAIPLEYLREREQIRVIQGPMLGLGILARLRRHEIDKCVVVNVKLMHRALAAMVRLSHIASCQTPIMFVDLTVASRRHSQPKVATV